MLLMLQSPSLACGVERGLAETRQQRLIALLYADVISFRCTCRIIHFILTSATATCLISDPTGSPTVPAYRMQRSDLVLTGQNSCEVEDSFIIVSALQMDDTADRHAE